VSISFAVTKTKATFFLLAAVVLSGCSAGLENTPDAAPVVKADKPFAAAGSIEMNLEGGDYTVQTSSDDHVRVSFAGNIGTATADLAVTGTHATLAVKNTPHNNFRATLEVPATSDLNIHLSGGNLSIGKITGNKDINSTAGNVKMAIPSANEYASVDASVKAGNLDAGPFGNSSSGVMPHLNWTGSGKYTLHATLGAGNLKFE